MGPSAFTFSKTAWSMSPSAPADVPCQLRLNRLQNNIFVNPPPLPLLYEISGALHLAQ